MNKLKLINCFVWVLFTIGSIFLTIVNFCAFNLIMSLVTGAITTIAFLEYFWTREIVVPETWKDED